MAKQEQPQRPAAPKSYRVLHTQVGPWPKGFVLSHEQATEHGAEIPRLLGLKAIEEVSEPPTGPTPLVPDEIHRQQTQGAATQPATAPGSPADAQAKGPVLP